MQRVKKRNKKLIAVTRLTTDNIEQNRVIYLENIDLGNIEVIDSWEELILIFLSIIAKISNGRVVDELKRRKVITKSLMIYSERFWLYNGDKKLKAYLIQNSNYYLVVDNIEAEEYIRVLRDLIKICNLKASQVKLGLEVKKENTEELAKEIRDSIGDTIPNRGELNNLSSKKLILLDDIGKYNFKLKGYKVGELEIAVKTLRGVATSLLNELNVGVLIDIKSERYVHYGIEVRNNRYKIGKISNIELIELIKLLLNDSRYNGSKFRIIV